ncbi:MAG: hypothetical protein AB7I79_05635 [Rhizobiaceae bacterium]
MRFGKLVACLALTISALLPGSASAQGPELKPYLGPEDLPVAMSAYVDGIVELRQFLTACGKGDPARDRGADLMIASLRGAGLDAGDAVDLRVRLSAGTQGATTYDCAGEVSTSRAEYVRLTDWLVYHRDALTRLDIAIVSPPAEGDPRLVKVEAVFAEHVPAQARVLSCMALILPDFYLLSYADWNGLLDRAAESMASAGFDAATQEVLIGPARPIRLSAHAPDRQPAIADCMTNKDWMTYSSTFRVFEFPSDVREALGQPR